MGKKKTYIDKEGEACNAKYMEGEMKIKSREELVRNKRM